MTRPAYCLFVAVALSCLAPHAAVAQDPGHDEARALFRAGVTASQAGEWADAADAFNRSLELRRSPVVVFNLGAALVRLERLSEAALLFEEVIEWDGARAAVIDAARTRLAEVEPRLSHLAVSLDGGEPEDELRVDDRVFIVDAVVTVDPGAHDLQVLRDGQTVLTSELELAEGESRNVRLEVPRAVVPDAATTAAFALVQAEQDEAILVDDGSQTVFETWWFWTAVGVVAVTVATVVLVAALQTGPDPIVGNTEPGVLRGMVEP